MTSMVSRTDPSFLAACRGEGVCDVAVVGGRGLNVFTRSFEPVSLGIVGGRFARVLWGGGEVDARVRVDGGGLVCAPGLIDAHMHVESTMLPPSRFVPMALVHGSTGAVFDPHEIANVLGMAGIRWILEDAAGLPFRAMFGASSCVPSSPLENAGAVLEAGDLAPLFDDPRVVALAEMMNFPGVIYGDAGVRAKLDMGLARGVVDGHAPGLRGDGLQAYVAAGISSDHECTTAEEAREKLALGMRVFIRQGSAAQNLAALAPIVDEGNAHRICFCTDDRHPHDLAEEGHINAVVRRAIAAGIRPELAYAMGSLHTAEHYGRVELGRIAPGACADFVMVEDSAGGIAGARPVHTVVEGDFVVRDGVATVEAGELAPWPGSGVRLPEGFGEGSLKGPRAEEGDRIRVIGMRPDQLLTQALERGAHVVDGVCAADGARDLLKIAVIERHRGSGNIGVAFIEGFGIRGGAIASTVGHDAHNLAVVGDNDGDMVVAARALAEVGGGQCVVSGGEVRAVLALPIAGLMSDGTVDEVIAAQRELLEAAKGLGCPHEDPFMPLSFMPLPVIPHLKVTDLGLVDVDAFAVVDVVVRGEGGGR